MLEFNSVLIFDQGQFGNTNDTIRYCTVRFALGIGLLSLVFGLVCEAKTKQFDQVKSTLKLGRVNSELGVSGY